MESIMKIYASTDYVDEKIPSTTVAHQQLVTDVDGSVKWEDRTHYAETAEIVVLSERTVTHEANDLVLSERLIEGCLYRILYDGEIYDGVVEAENTGEEVFLYISSEKFAIEQVYPGEAHNCATFYCPNTDTHTISITRCVNRAFPLNVEYLPEQVRLYDEVQVIFRDLENSSWSTFSLKNP